MTQTIIRTPEDYRDYAFEADSEDRASRSYNWNLSIIPRRKDLRNYTGAVEHQAQYGACSGNAVCSALECILLRSNKFVDLSRLFVYYNARLAALQPGEVIRDAGAGLHLALEQCRKMGVATEAVWSYSRGVNVEPDQQAIADGYNRMIQRYERLGKGVELLDDILIALANNIPVIFGMHILKPFQTIFGASAGHLAKYNPARIEVTDPDYAGAHGMVIVGYNLNDKTFIVENSWGAAWGDHGYAILSFDNVLQNGFDFFAVREFAEIKLPINPQYRIGYEGEIAIEPDDVEFVFPVDTSRQDAKATFLKNAVLLIVISAVIFFLTNQ